RRHTRSKRDWSSDVCSSDLRGRKHDPCGRRSMSYTSSNTIRTVATREIAVAMRNKGIIFSLIITLFLAIGGIGVASYFNNREDSAPALAVVGISAEQFRQVQDSLGDNVEKLR